MNDEICSQQMLSKKFALMTNYIGNNVLMKIIICWIVIFYLLLLSCFTLLLK